MVAIHGPLEFRSQGPAGLIIDVSVRIPSGIPGPAERSIEDVARIIIQECVDSNAFHSRTLVVSIDVLDDNGSLLSVVANGIALVLLESGLPLTTVATASTHLASFGKESAQRTVQVVVCSKTGKLLYGCVNGIGGRCSALSHIYQDAMTEGDARRRTLLDELITHTKASARCPW